ncbi:MAG: HIT family protein [Kangiella sp.]|nr:MAG: HIT family protein [Kangiella sp.]
MDCIFCNLSNDRIIQENELFIVINDGYPVTQYHQLIIPKRCVKTWFELNEKELTSLNNLLHKQKYVLEQENPSITGFNIGMNCGEDAGQTVMHCHVHLIPRRKGDMDEPRGGVRGVIPEKQAY